MILVQLTNGFGNNLFQYNAGKLLANFLGQEVCVIPPSHDYYAIPCLEKLGMDLDPPHLSGYNMLNDGSYKSAFDKKYVDYNFFLKGYFEDYTIFKSDIKKIKGWYPPVEKRQNKDLVIHFRAGDRLFYKNEFYTKPPVESFIGAIEKYDFDNLHIVTDMPKWDYITERELKEMQFHREVPAYQSVEPSESVDYFNSFVDGFSSYKPIMKNRTVSEDFNFIRTFDNILFQHGTLSWWASVLSEASQVGVYGPWRPWKGDSNKNLSKIDLTGWFQWE